MASFLIYLFESGLCLSLFYLGYIVFFRKETYFTFIRFYLLGSMILAITVPLISLPVDFNKQGYLQETATNIRQFKDYYEHLILLTDPGALADPMAIAPKTTQESSNQIVSKPTVISISGILISIYILGVLFFTFRLLFLFRELSKLIGKAEIQKDKDSNLVIIKDEIPPFSFLKWIFVNPAILKPEEYEQVLTHEKVHVQHKHSVDLLLAHIITIFQWFNPLTWRIQKSIKTCHEYIADRKVVEQGHGLFDYQSLLLSQLISIRSVELVNNFNLLSIKKRIAMMNKHKSGKWAQLKAIAIVPILLAAFFFFTDMTSRRENLNLEISRTKDVETITGSWIANEHHSGNVQFLEIKDNKLFTVTPVKNSSFTFHDYTLETNNNKLILTEEGIKKEIHYKLRNNTLKIDWGSNSQVEYIRKPTNDSYTLMKNQFEKINLPYATQLNPYKSEMILTSISLSGSKLFVDGKSCKFSELEDRIKQLRASVDPTTLKKMTVLLRIDKDVSMEYVDKVKISLRKTNTLKLAYEAIPINDKDQLDRALFNLLPPMDAKWIEKEELNSKGISLFEIGSQYSDFSEELIDFTKAHRKYVMLYEYNNQTSYNDYIQTIDLVYKTLNSRRKEAAFFNGEKYEDLTFDQQKEYRKKYPITLTMKNSDEN